MLNEKPVKSIRILTVILYAVLFGITAYLSLQLRNAPPTEIDLNVSRWVQAIDLAGFHTTMVLFTLIGTRVAAAIIMAIVLFFFVTKRMWIEAIFVLVTLAGDLFSTLLKVWVARPRPSPELVMIFEPSIDFAYPSGHAVHVVIFYGFLAFLAWTLLQRSVLRYIILGLSILMVVLTGVSRIYLGGHWLTDVIGGYAVGLLWLSGIITLYRMAKRRRGKGRLPAGV